ncbi:MAG TPA: NifU family protein [Bacteroidia bacterium]|jgi:Fe-S cluster biogenesis protein NfuA|nr:NifU family protein [Bacteroidia bacterium]
MNNPTMISKIENALEQVRPFLKADGGDISLVEVTDDFVVKVKLLGACKGCSISHITMKAGIEEAIKNAVPEIKKVEAINE